MEFGNWDSYQIGESILWLIQLDHLVLFQLPKVIIKNQYLQPLPHDSELAQQVIKTEPYSQISILKTDIHLLKTKNVILKQKRVFRYSIKRNLSLFLIQQLYQPRVRQLLKHLSKINLTDLSLLINGSNQKLRAIKSIHRDSNPEVAEFHNQWLIKIQAAKYFIRTKLVGRHLAKRVAGVLRELKQRKKTEVLCWR
jgi:hypothetical protein